jgi:hypothetical protein
MIFLSLAVLANRIMDVQTTESIPQKSLQVLLAGTIDYAGLFPPSQISMPEAVINYATYKNSNYEWLLGRFIVPFGRLEEFYESARDFISRDGKSAWRISVIAGEDINDTIRQIEDFNGNNAPGVICDAIELKASTGSKIENTVSALPPGINAYFELPLVDDLDDLVSALAFTGQRAKIRTGGVTTDTFPTARQIIRFARTCLSANVPFKATAGLHHPLRCFRPLTYAPDSPEGAMHGFLNVFLMTGFAREGFRTMLLEDLMEEEYEEAFKFDENGVTWHEHGLGLAQLERARTNGIISFGSCSFDEPIADLRHFGLL